MEEDSVFVHHLCGVIDLNKGKVSKEIFTGLRQSTKEFFKIVASIILKNPKKYPEKAYLRAYQIMNLFKNNDKSEKYYRKAHEYFQSGGKLKLNSIFSNINKDMTNIVQKMSGSELYKLVQDSDSFESVLDSIKSDSKTETQSKRGNVFEKVCDLIIKFGYHPTLQNDTYDHYEGSINTGNLKKVSNLETYVKKMSVFSKGKGGSSDITLRHKESGRWVFISSKYRFDDSKHSIDSFDVEKIMAIVKENPYLYKEYEIHLIVKDKRKVLDTILYSQETNKFIKDNIKTILGLKELENYFKDFKRGIQQVNISDINSVFCNTKVPLKLRFHQTFTIMKIIEKIREGKDEFLIGFKPRSGKTYTVGGLLSEFNRLHLSRNEVRLNALIITPAPSETMSQFTDDLFHKFTDFIGINIVEIKRGSDIKDIKWEANNIVIVSKQLLDDYVLENAIESLKRLNLNFIVCDENHFHGTTEMSKNIMATYTVEGTIKVYLTATYAKPLHIWNIPQNSQYFWDIEDEKMCKTRDIKGLADKHGGDVYKLLSDKNKDIELSPYDNMPDLELITTVMSGDQYEVINNKIQGTPYGFSHSALLSGNFPVEVDTVLRYITGSDKEKDYPKGDLSIFSRIKKISLQKGSRTKLNNGDFTSQLWFLPFGRDMAIEKVSESLRERMLHNRILQKYEIKIVNSKKDYKLKDIKEHIRKLEMKAKEEGKDGLILLAGNQLTLGITLPFVDIVFLFTDAVSSDKIVQMMYRCMTERIRTVENDKINSGDKTVGFVVDLNPSRVLNTVIEYKVPKKDLSMEESIRYIVENNLISIDTDLFASKSTKAVLIDKLIQIWRANPVNNVKTLLKNMENVSIELEAGDQKKLNSTFTSSVKDKKGGEKVRMDPEGQESLPTGRQLVERDGGEDEKNEVRDNEEKVIEVSLTKDILPYIVPLACILTMNREGVDILEMLNEIGEDPVLLDVFNDQCSVWWEHKVDFLKMIKKVFLKYIKKDSHIYNMAMQFKMSLQDMIDRPKELLELIDSCLKPKDKEKQENGEVFTPMALIEEMLDALDTNYIEQNDISIFSDTRLKWFDPAVGMGNFIIAVYLRLMDGLEVEIPNIRRRKRHILENMLYMSELNKKNVFVCQQIFNGSGKYKLNLYEGDSLELDVESEFKVELNGFDVVLGNPPYNKGGIRSHTGKKLGAKNETIWTKFIEKSFEWLKPDGFLVFINPLSWLKKSHSLHDEMLEKHIVWLKLWDNSQSKAMINADIPISLFVLQNIINSSNKKTEITSILKRRSLTTKSTEYLNPKYSIPLAFHSIFNKLIDFIEKNDLQLEYKTKTVKSTGTKVKLPLEYTLRDTWAVDTYTIKEGIMVKKATEIHPDANKRKLIISNKASFTGAFIDEGVLSLTGNHKFYILGDNLEFIKKMLNFSIIKIIGNYTKYGQDFLDNDAFKYIPDIRKLGISNITEDEFYNLIELTQEEILQIKK